ncbi:MAG TPA: hypothetical protein DE313_07780 [Ruminococcus sp.]|nr:hypothetical protein [Ruminococcus sp.]
MLLICHIDALYIRKKLFIDTLSIMCYSLFVCITKDVFIIELIIKIPVCFVTGAVVIAVNYIF